MNEKLLIIGERLFALVVINAMIIVCSLPLITILPAISAGAIVIRQFREDEQINIFKTYFKAFKTHLPKKLLRTFVLGFWAFVMYKGVSTYTLSFPLMILLSLCAMEWLILTIGSILSFIASKPSFADAFIMGHRYLKKVIGITFFCIVGIILLMMFNWLITLFTSGLIYLMYESDALLKRMILKRLS